MTIWDDAPVERVQPWFWLWWMTVCRCYWGKEKG